MEAHNSGEVGDSMLGRTVGNYVIESKLGEGGMGAVYRARHVRLPDTCAAVKVMAAGADGSASLSRRFEQEALVASAVGSHRVVKPIDVGQFEDGTPYILMELVEGRSLAAEIRARGPLPLAQSLRIAARVADTMAIAHARGIIHRDLKPPNLMLARQGHEDAVKILDFGVARASGAIKVAHTDESAVIGTPGYMSPEALVAGEIDDRTDVFSLGVILFEMLTGQLPFPSGSRRLAAAQVLTTPAPSIASMRPAGAEPIPTEVEALLSRALAKDPAARPSMAELVTLLSQALAKVDQGEQKQISIFEPATLDAPATAASRHFVGYALVAAVLVVAAAIAIPLLRSREPRAATHLGPPPTAPVNSAFEVRTAPPVQTPVTTIVAPPAVANPAPPNHDEINHSPIRRAPSRPALRALTGAPSSTPAATSPPPPARPAIVAPRPPGIKEMEP